MWLRMQTNIGVEREGLQKGDLPNGVNGGWHIRLQWSHSRPLAQPRACLLRPHSFRLLGFLAPAPSAYRPLPLAKPIRDRPGAPIPKGSSSRISSGVAELCPLGRNARLYKTVTTFTRRLS